MSLGRYNTYFGNGSAVTSVYDVETGEHRPTVLADGEMAARLCDALPQVDFVMAYAHPGDHDPHVALLQSFRAMVKNTTKPLCVVAENRRDLAAMTHVAAAVRGGDAELAAKPYFVLYLEPTSALSHPVDSLDKLLLCADHGIPAIYSPAPLAGGTAPITIAGQVCQGAAESLLGLVIHQLRKPGAPFLFGIGPAVLDMATSQSSYNAPEYLMGYICAVELARWLDLPNWGYAGTTDAQVIDAQAGMEAAELTFLSLAIGSNLNHDLGYLDFGMTGSLELIVLADEFLAMNRKLFAGVEVTPETLAVDVVRDVGPGGDFLAHRHTARNVRKAQWRPTILNRQGHVRWAEEGGLDLKEKARRKALRLLADAPARAAGRGGGGAHRRAGRRVHSGGVSMSFGAELPETASVAASVAAVHESALRVLERTGVLVQDEEAVELLRARGARSDGSRVFLDEDLVQRALATVPSSFVLAGRRPELGLPLGGADGRIFASGSGAAYMLEGLRMRRGTLADLEATAKLGHQLPAIDFNSDCMEPLDLPEAVRTRRGTHARLVQSDKAIEWVASVDEDADESRAHQRDPLRCGVARPPARPDRAEHHRAAADLRRDGADHAPLGPAGTARVHDLLRDGWDHRTGDRRRRARRAARRGARDARARAGGSRGLAVRLRRPAGDGVAAHGRRPVRLARVLAAGRRDRAPRASLRSAGPRGRGHDRRPCRGRARDGRVRRGAVLGRVRRRPLPLPGYGHTELVQRAVAREVRPGRRLHREPAHGHLPRARGWRRAGRGHHRRRRPRRRVSGQGAHAAARAGLRAPEPAAAPAPEPFERWAAAGGEDAVAAAARRVRELLAAHEPPDDLDAVTRRQLDEYCLA